MGGRVAARPLRLSLSLTGAVAAYSQAPAGIFRAQSGRQRSRLIGDSMFRSAALQIPAFRRLWVGQAVSQFGDALYGLLFLFMVDRLTGSAAMVGFVGALQALPFLVLGPYAGALADRIDRKRVMLLADLSSALLLFGFAALLFFMPRPPIAVVFSVAFLLASINVFFLPAKSAAIPALVPAEHLMEANSLSSATQNMMPMIGIALSGAALGLLYGLYPGVFFIAAASLNALSFLYSGFCIAGLPSILPDREGATARHPMHDALDGFKFLQRDHVLKVHLVLSCCLNLFISPYMVVFVAANRRWFGGQFSTLAIGEASFLFFVVVTTLFIRKRAFTRPTLGFIWGLGLIGLCVAAMGLNRSFAAYCFWNCLCGVLFPFAQIPMATFIQLRVPDAYRGRVGSAMTLATVGVGPLSMGAAGWLLDRLSLPTVFAIMGLGMGAAAFAGALDSPFRLQRMPETPAAKVE